MAQVNFRVEYGDGSASGCSSSMNQDHVLANERLGENIMALEFAIKREIAYRARIEKLQSRPTAGTMPRPQGQHPIPNPSLVGMKRKALSDNAQFSPTQQPHPSYSRRTYQNCPESLFCKVCQLACSSLECMKQHKQGNRHKVNLENYVEFQQRENGGRQKWCKVCRVPCSDEKAYAQHLAGRKHAAVVSGRMAKEEARREFSKVKWDELEWEMV